MRAHSKPHEVFRATGCVPDRHTEKRQKVCVTVPILPSKPFKRRPSHNVLAKTLCDGLYFKFIVVSFGESV